MKLIWMDYSVKLHIVINIQTASKVRNVSVVLRPHINTLYVLLGHKQGPEISHANDLTDGANNPAIYYSIGNGDDDPSFNTG